MDLVERQGSSTRHPWEVARAEFFLRLLRREGLLQQNGHWLDAGAGDAWFAGQLRRQLPAEATITCWDINYRPEDIEALSASTAQGMSVVAERPKERFDRVLMLDVIEHVEDDADFVAGAVSDLLADGGMMLLSVPAYQRLFSSHDRVLRHFRRYSPAACRRVLQRAGLEVVVHGGLFLSLLPVRVAQVLRERVRPPSSLPSGIGDWRGGGAVTTALTRALVTDGRLSLLLGERGLVVPGLSYWALCRAAR
jgi:hypothetical protein